MHSPVYFSAKNSKAAIERILKYFRVYANLRKYKCNVIKFKKEEM